MRTFDDDDDIYIYIYIYIYVCVGVEGVYTPPRANRAEPGLTGHNLRDAAAGEGKRPRGGQLGAGG